MSSQGGGRRWPVTKFDDSPADATDRVDIARAAERVRKKNEYTDAQRRDAVDLYKTVMADGQAARGRRDQASAGFRHYLAVIATAIGAIVATGQSLGWPATAISAGIFGISVAGAVLMFIWWLELTVRQKKIRESDRTLDAIEQTSVLPINPRELRRSQRPAFNGQLWRWCMVTTHSVPLVFFFVFATVAAFTWPF